MEYTVSSQNVHDQNINMSAHGFEYFKSAGKIMLIQIFLEKHGVHIHVEYMCSS